MARFLPFLALLAAFAFPLLPVPDFWVTLANYIGISAIVAIGLVVLTGVGGMTSFGQAAFVGFGAYATALVTVKLGLSPWLGLPVALVVTGIAAWFIGVITLRLSGHYLPLGTIAWSISLFYVFGNLDLFGRFDGISGIPPLAIGTNRLIGAREYYFVIWIAVALSVVATLNLLDSRVGRSIRALKGGAVAARSSGIDTARARILAFVYAGLLAGLAGWLYAHMQRAVNPTPFGLNAGIEYLLMAVVGGVGHVWGAILGAGLVTILKDQLQNVLPKLIGAQGNFEAIVFGAILVLLLQGARDGLWPILMRLVPQRSKHHHIKAETAAPLERRALPAPGTPLLEVKNLRKQFGGLTAVNDVNFALNSGEILGLIGPNGAGKSTTFNLITGVLPATSGEVSFRGQPIRHLPPRAIAKLGIARTFQHVKLVPGMSVLENAALGAHLRGSAGALQAITRLDRAEENRLLAEAARQLTRVGLGDSLDKPATSLPLGKQRVLEIASALALDPVLLLLDEPAAGLRALEKRALADLLRQLRADGVSVLLVEHDMEFVMGLTDKLVVLDFGTKLAEGAPAEVRTNPAVIEAYLGSAA